MLNVNKQISQTSSSIFNSILNFENKQKFSLFIMKNIKV